MKISEKNPNLRGAHTDPRTRSYLTPKRVVLTEGDVRNAEALLKDKPNQITLVPNDLCTMVNQPGKPHAKLVLDYGCEFPGSIRLMIQNTRSKDAGDNRRCNIIVRTGESVMEALTPIYEKNTTNDHAIRDRVMNVGFYSANETNESGQRFVCIELIDDDATVEFKAVQGVFHYLDLDYKGSFACSDEKITRIWETAAYTAHVNMQEYLWDGIKRDRLVWIGDMHTEVNTILATFGYNEVVPRSLDLLRDETPIGKWMNGTSSYSVWWLMIHYDWYLAFGDKAYLEEQREYIKGLLTYMSTLVDENGSEKMPGGRLLDWPTSPNVPAIHAGHQCFMKIAMDKGAFLMRELGEYETAALCEQTSKHLARHIPDPNGSKPAASLMALCGLADVKETNEKILVPGGGHGYSTFFGYYILAVKALAGDLDGALRDMKEYWGGMLDVGATSFWEDFNLDWLENAGRIDEVVPEGKVDIHGSYGGYCYVKFRHSLCHGWASGPCPFLSNYVLGVRNIAPGKYEVKPELAWLDWAKGTYPTPKGEIAVHAFKDANGQTVVEIDAPEGIEILR